MQTIVLSSSVFEVYAWADAKGHHRRSVRHIPNAGALQGRAYDAIVELPSFAQRRDRHSITAAVRKLQRAKPGIPYQVDSEWVMPPKPKRVPKSSLEPTLFLFANAPVEVPVERIYAQAVDMEAEEDYSVEDADDEGADITPEETQEAVGDAIKSAGRVQDILAEDDAAEVPPVTAEVTAHETFEVVQPVEAEARPKRRGRRTNEQKAYDEAKAAQEERPGDAATTDALVAAEEALRKRHPDDERLAKPEASDLDGLGF